MIIDSASNGKRRIHIKKKSDCRYQTTQWKSRRAFHIADHPHCKKCFDEGRGLVTGGKQRRRGGKETFVKCAVDHIIPWRSGATKEEQDRLFFEGELQTLCPSCHTKKTYEDQDNYVLYPSIAA